MDQRLKIDISGLSTTLAEAMQFARGQDAQLYRAVRDVAIAMQADALIARIGLEGHIFATFRPPGPDRKGKERATRDVLKMVGRLTREQGAPIRYIDGGADSPKYLVHFPGKHYKSQTGGQIEPRDPVFFCFVYARERPSFVAKLGVESKVDGRTSFFVFQENYETVNIISSLLSMAVEYYLNLNYIFPKGVVEEMWKVIEDSPRQKARIKPWDDLANGDYPTIKTATISVDLRQSTFAMESAINKKEYADWVEGFVQILRRITHDNSGVFDKFTGDGVIVHFIASAFEKWSTAEQALVRQAVKCGWEMMYAVREHLGDLRPLLSLDNFRVGAAVGVAVDDAMWSVDRSGNPIVVGRGVVHACRANVTPAMTMSLTNRAYKMLCLSEGRDVPAESVPFETKEYAKESGVLVTRLNEAPKGLCRPVSELRRVCEETRAELATRRRH